MLLRMYIALGRAARLQGRADRSRATARRPASSRRRIAGQGRERLRLAQDGIGRAPPGAHLALRCATRAGTRASASVWVYPVVDDNDRYRHQRERLSRSTPSAPPAPAVSTSTRTELGRAHHPYADRHRRRNASRSARSTKNRATAWQHAEGARSTRWSSSSARTRPRPSSAAQDRHRLGPPDPLLRAAALPDGQGPAHRRRDQRHAGRARRRHRPLHRGEPRPARQGRRPGESGGSRVGRTERRPLSAERGSQLPPRAVRHACPRSSDFARNRRCAMLRRSARRVGLRSAAFPPDIRPRAGAQSDLRQRQGWHAWACPRSSRCGMIWSRLLCRATRRGHRMSINRAASRPLCLAAPVVRSCR